VSVAYVEASYLAQPYEAGAVDLVGRVGSALNHDMIEVDDSELPEDDREFLERWAEVLQVPPGVLVLRIVEAAIDGDQYIAMRPRDD
jgi:hypothetical protein